MPWLLFALGLFSVALTANVFRPVMSRAVPAGVSFFVGWLTAELAVHHLAWQLVVAALLVWRGALAAWPGDAGLALCIVSWCGLTWAQATALGSRDAMLSALTAGLGDDYEANTLPALRVPAEAPPWPVARLSRPFHYDARDVEVVRDRVFFEEGSLRLRLDVYRPARAAPDGAAGLRPVMVYVHGGAWVVGDKQRQGLPLLHHLASHGWVCATISYRKSPRATFPDHLIDVKRAVAWVREHIAEYGGDPSFVMIAGGSAGGHLAALAALTPNDPRYQPGFESADTRLAGCVGFYGVYDFLDRFGHWPNRGLRTLLERRVMKTSPDADRDAWERASPMALVHRDAPPFLLIHGTHDSLVPIDEARAFARTLRAVSEQPVALVEFEGAQHAFEVFPSARTVLAHEAVDRFAAWVRSQPVTTRRDG